MVHKTLWLAVILAPRVVLDPKVLVKKMQDGLQIDYKRMTKYHQMWRAKDHICDWYLGGQCHSFHLIPPLLERIQEVDPGAIIDWDTWEGTTVFNRDFICHSATRKALSHWQTLVS